MNPVLRQCICFLIKSFFLILSVSAIYSPSRIVKLEELGLDSEIVRLESQIVAERERQLEAQRKQQAAMAEQKKRKRIRMMQIKKE